MLLGRIKNRSMRSVACKNDNSAYLQFLIMFPNQHFTSFLAWAWLAKANAGIPKKSILVKISTEEKRVKVRSTTCHYATKKRPVKITVYLGLDIIIKLKFTTDFDRCAILNVLNYLTKNFES